MKNIPVFTTEYGAASLVLEEIPYRQEAYIHIRSSLEPEKLVEECVGFCRACGAEKIYASGHPVLEGWPLHTAVVEMRCPREILVGSDAAVFPVTEKTLDSWRALYEQRMRRVPNAASMTRRGAEELLRTGDGYFVHRNGRLLGLGRASDGTIHTVISVAPGGGAEVVRAMAGLLTEEVVALQVARKNEKAVALYQRLGFTAVKELSRWYRVYGED